MAEPLSTGVDVVVAGHTCLDLLPDLRGLPAGALESQGRLFQVGDLRVSTGGAVPNTGLALHRLGNRVRLLTTVGDDLVGRATLDVIRRVSPDLAEHIQVRRIPGSYAIVLWRPGLDRTFLHCTGPNDHFSMDDVDFSLVHGARWFHFGYPSLLPRLFEGEGQGLAEVMKRAKATGAVTSLDFTLPDPATPSGRANWPAILRAVLPSVDVFVPSLEELVYLLRRKQYMDWSGDILPHTTRALVDELMVELLEMGPAIVGIKLGDQGMIMMGGHQRRLEQLDRIDNALDWTNHAVGQPAFDVTIPGGTTGAGDAAYAGLITGLLHGLTPDDVVRLSCAAGAARVEATDDQKLTPWAELLARFTPQSARLPSAWM